MTVLRALARSEERAIQTLPWGEWPGDTNRGQAWSGSTVTPSSSLQLLTVYGCNRFICEGISTLPVDTYRGVDGQSVPLPNPRWLDQPTVDLDRVSWLTQILTSLLLNGNAYLRKTWKDTQLDQLVPLDPTRVVVQRVNGRKAYTVAGKPVDPFDILHIPGVMRPGADEGMSPIEAARQSIGLGLASLESGARFFGQGQQMSGVIQTPGALQPEKAKELAKAFSKAHAGTAKAHLPAVLEGGATWQATGVTNEQAQFLATREYTEAQIAAQLFLIDPSEFGLNASGNGRGAITYANLEQRNARKVQVTFLPWLVRLERAFSGLLPQPRFVKFNVDGLLRGDTATRYAAHKVGIDGHFLLPNEARAFEDMMPLPGGDEFPPAAPAVQANARAIERDEHGRILRVVG